jgi:hypothetical protein
MQWRRRDSNPTPDRISNRSEPTFTANAQRALPDDLLLIIDRWPSLPDAVKSGILAMVRATTTERKAA